MMTGVLRPDWNQSCLEYFAALANYGDRHGLHIYLYLIFIFRLPLCLEISVTFIQIWPTFSAPSDYAEETANDQGANIV
jgi:hypothetical protein